MQDLAVDLGQGFYFGQPTERPMAVDTRLVRARSAAEASPLDRRGAVWIELALSLRPLAERALSLASGVPMARMRRGFWRMPFLRRTCRARAGRRRQ